MDVLTPHIGGVVEFFRKEGEDLRIAAQVPGYTSHMIDTLNLDMASAGSIRWRRPPNGAAAAYAGLHRFRPIRRTQDSVEIAWTVSVDGQVVTNLAAVTLSNTTLAVGVGRGDGVLRLWLSEF